MKHTKPRLTIEKIKTGGEPRCPKCKETAQPRYIGKSLVFDCDGCKDQVSSEAIEYWSV